MKKKQALKRLFFPLRLLLEVEYSPTTLLIRMMVCLEVGRSLLPQRCLHRRVWLVITLTTMNEFWLTAFYWKLRMPFQLRQGKTLLILTANSCIFFHASRFFFYRKVYFPDAIKVKADGTQVQVDEVEKLPGELHVLKIKAPQGTRLGLLSVDQSVYHLRNTNRLTKGRVNMFY